MLNCSKVRYTKFRDDRPIGSRIIIGKPEGGYINPLCRRWLTWRPEDLTPLDFFLGGCLKSVVYQRAPETLSILKQAIRAAIWRIPPATCTHETEEARRRAALCVTQNGRHFEHVTS